MSKELHDFKQELKRLEIIYQLLTEKDLRGLRVIEVEQDIKKSLSYLTEALEEKLKQI